MFDTIVKQHEETKSQMQQHFEQTLRSAGFQLEEKEKTISALKEKIAKNSELNETLKERITGAYESSQIMF
jgi:uncharacterized protein Smg (DUF494 family)